MISNNARVGRALYLLKLELDNFIPRQFVGHHDEEAATVLHQILGQPRDAERPFHNMKTQDLLSVMQASWWDVFNRAMGSIEPVLVREIATYHETWASRQNFAPDAAFQALNSIQKLLAAMSSPNTLELEMLKVESLESAVEAQEAAVVEAAPPSHGPAQNDTATAEPEVVDIEEPESVFGEAFTAEVSEEPKAEPYLTDLVRFLREAGALQDGDFLAQSTRDRVQPHYAGDALLKDLNPSLAQALASLGCDNLYDHQGRAHAELLSGSNVVVEAGWAAEEVLTYAIPLAETLLRNPGGHALILCAEEAGAFQVSDRLVGLLSEVGIRILTCLEKTATFEPETTEEVPSTAVVTTLDFVNHSLLGRQQDWQGFLKSLKFVVIDQGQAYRGYFGSNVAVLLRRLVHSLAIQGTDPRYCMVAAGCSNCVEFAQSLTGKAFEVVSALDTASPRRHYLFVDPAAAELSVDIDLPDRVGRAVLACVESGKSVAVCCLNEELVQECYSSVLEQCKARGVDKKLFSLAGTGGPGSEQGGGQWVSDKNPVGAVFTSMAPNGVNVAQERDGVILVGFPDTPGAALRVIEGVGGRDEREAFAIFYSLGDSDNRFFAHNLSGLLVKGPDLIGVDADISEIVQSHIPHLVSESEGRVYSFSREVLGSTLFQALRRDGTELASVEELNPEEIDLRPRKGKLWSLWSDDEQVGVLPSYQGFREAYPGAILAFRGARYRVAELQSDPGTGASARVVLETSEQLTGLKTEPEFATGLAIRDDSLGLSLATGLSLHLGNVTLEERLVQITLVDESVEPVPDEQLPEERGSKGRIIGTHTPVEEVSWHSVAQAFWIDIGGLLDEESGSPEGDESVVGRSVAPAVEQMLRVGARFSFPVGAYDLITYSEGSRIFLVETGPDAQGIVKKAFDRWRDILEFGASLARQCECEKGCPYCIVPPFPYNKSVDKVAGLELADRLLEATRET